MNFDQAIAAHSAWKQKLGVYLAKPDKSIDASKLEKDDQCDLGKWIHGEAAMANVSSSAFVELKNEHARFHKAAADVVRRADSGQSVSEEVALGAKSAYGECSANVVKALMRMKRESSNAA